MSPSNFRGVRETKGGKFRVDIYNPGTGKSQYVGTYLSSNDAAIAYDIEAMKFSGEKVAKTNFTWEKPPLIEPTPVPRRRRRRRRSPGGSSSSASHQRQQSTSQHAIDQALGSSSGNAAGCGSPHGSPPLSPVSPRSSPRLSPSLPLWLGASSVPSPSTSPPPSPPPCNCPNSHRRRTTSFWCAAEQALSAGSGSPTPSPPKCASPIAHATSPAQAPSPPHLLASYPPHTPTPLGVSSQSVQEVIVIPDNPTPGVGYIPNEVAEPSIPPARKQQFDLNLPPNDEP